MNETLHSVRLNFGGTKRYRKFPFLPRVGDRINVTDGETSFSLDVDEVWFDDNYGEDTCDVQINCTIADETPFSGGPSQI